jgi:hypothetical protein
MAASLENTSISIILDGFVDAIASTTTFKFGLMVQTIVNATHILNPLFSMYPCNIPLLGSSWDDLI